MALFPGDLPRSLLEQWLRNHEDTSPVPPTSDDSFTFAVAEDISPTTTHHDFFLTSSCLNLGFGW